MKKYDQGYPDGGLFTPDQLRKPVDVLLKAGQRPARGAIEAKKAAVELATLAASSQVAGYVQDHGIVLVTNLRQFAVVDAHGVRERFSLADTEDAFWTQVVAHPQGSAERMGKPMAEFLARACLHDAPLTNPKDVAWFLASYARDALDRVERRKELPALAAVRIALEQSLGMTFTGPDGEHFFRSTLVQTLFYGVFSAWVKWCEDAPPITAAFDWHAAAWTLHVPFIQSLYNMSAQPATLGPLGLAEPIDWAAAALNRVKRDEFFARFERSHAVQYFYEPFLEAYDPQLRKDLGVWYTPPEVVKYQVARVDRVLRDELNLPGGLAHKDVVVLLDPCCGTGAYLVEVLRTIAALSGSKSPRKDNLSIRSPEQPLKRLFPVTGRSGCSCATPKAVRRWPRHEFAAPAPWGRRSPRRRSVRLRRRRQLAGNHPWESGRARSCVPAIGRGHAAGGTAGPTGRRARRFASTRAGQGRVA